MKDTAKRKQSTMQKNTAKLAHTSYTLYGLRSITVYMVHIIQYNILAMSSLLKDYIIENNSSILTIINRITEVIKIISSHLKKCASSPETPATQLLGPILWLCRYYLV